MFDDLTLGGGGGVVLDVEWLMKDVMFVFAVILNGDVVDDLFMKLKEVVDSHSSPVAWLPSKEKL